MLVFYVTDYQAFTSLHWPEENVKELTVILGPSHHQECFIIIKVCHQSKFHSHSKCSLRHQFHHVQNVRKEFLVSPPPPSIWSSVDEGKTPIHLSVSTSQVLPTCIWQWICYVGNFRKGISAKSPLGRVTMPLVDLSSLQNALCCEVSENQTLLFFLSQQTTNSWSTQPSGKFGSAYGVRLCTSFT